MIIGNNQDFVKAMDEAVTWKDATDTVKATPTLVLRNASKAYSAAKEFRLLTARHEFLFSVINVELENRI